MKNTTPASHITLTKKRELTLNTAIANIDITVTIFDTYKQSNYGNEFFEMEKEDKQRVA